MSANALDEIVAILAAMGEGDEAGVHTHTRKLICRNGDWTHNNAGERIRKGVKEAMEETQGHVQQLLAEQEKNPFHLYDKPGRDEATAEIQAVIDRTAEAHKAWRAQLGELADELSRLRDKHEDMGTKDSESRWAITDTWRLASGRTKLWGDR